MNSMWLLLFSSPEYALPSFLAFIWLCWTWRGYVFSAPALLLVIGLTLPGLGVKLYPWLKLPFTPPSTLLNGFVFIHPPLLYLSWWTVLALLLATSYSMYWPAAAEGRLRKKHKGAILLVLLSLYLGGSWAQQELNWGGWWSWDLVEVGTLGLFLLSCGSLHLPILSYKQVKSLYIYLLTLYVFFFGLRYGFFNSIHSFVGPSQLDFKTRAPLYFIMLTAFWWRTQERTAHLGSFFLYTAGLICFLAFSWDMGVRYWDFVVFPRLSQLLVLSFLLCLWSVGYQTIATFHPGVAPSFVFLIQPSFFFPFKGRLWHLGVVVVLLGGCLSKFPLVLGVSPYSSDLLGWVVHHSYMLTTVGESTPLNAASMFIRDHGSLTWGVKPLPVSLQASFPFGASLFAGGGGVWGYLPSSSLLTFAGGFGALTLVFFFCLIKKPATK